CRRTAQSSIQSTSHSRPASSWPGPPGPGGPAPARGDGLGGLEALRSQVGGLRAPPLGARSCRLNQVCGLVVTTLLFVARLSNRARSCPSAPPSWLSSFPAPPAWVASTVTRRRCGSPGRRRRSARTCRRRWVRRPCRASRRWARQRCRASRGSWCRRLWAPTDPRVVCWLTSGRPSAVLLERNFEYHRLIVAVIEGFGRDGDGQLLGDDRRRFAVDVGGIRGLRVDLGLNIPVTPGANFLIQPLIRACRLHGEGLVAERLELVAVLILDGTTVLAL